MVDNLLFTVSLSRGKNGFGFNIVGGEEGDDPGKCFYCIHNFIFQNSHLYMSICNNFLGFSKFFRNFLILSYVFF